MWVRYAVTFLVVMLLTAEQPPLLHDPVFWGVTGVLLLGVTSEPIWRRPFWLYFLLTAVVCAFATYAEPMLIVWLLPLSFIFFYSRNEQASGRGIAALGLISSLGVVVSHDVWTMRLFVCAYLIFTVWCLFHYYRSQRLLREKDRGIDELTYEYKKLKRQLSLEEEALKQAERVRIARNVHDSVGHRLTGLIMQLQMLEMQADHDASQIAQAKETARSALQDMRQAVQSLESDEKKGVQMIIQLIRKLEAETHVRVSFTTKSGALSVPLTDEQSVALYRFVQEGLTNAMRHAYARKAAVTFEVAGGQTYIVTMTNPVQERIQVVEGFGLTQLRQRFEHLGGTFCARCSARTFRVEGTFPLKRKEV